MSNGTLRALSSEKLKEILDSHAQWAREYFDLHTASWFDDRRADLSGADLCEHAEMLRSARLDGARLDGARLDGASLDGASLDGASLVRARLDGASLDGATMPFEVPIVKDIDAQILAAITDENGDLRMATDEDGDEVSVFNMSDWHNVCGTSHCRAGWAITLAGPEGRMMEKILGPNVAGALIYAASRPGKPIPDFYASNDEALASIKSDAAAAGAV